MQHIFFKYRRVWGLTGLLLAVGCKEKPIPIPDLKVGTRKVLVEELTGVRCGNCPDGTKDLVDLRKRLEQRVVVVAIHAAPGFDAPYTESRFDFRTAKGTQMANFIGQAAFFPSAAINRRLVPPEQELFLPRSIWAGIVAEELNKQPVAGIVLNPTFNAATRRLDAEVVVVPERALTGEHRLTVVITQDSILDVQNVVVTKTPNYYQRYVLREILTAPLGDPIQGPLDAQNTAIKRFSAVLPASWEARQCRVVAYLHRSEGNNKEVLQVAEMPIVR